MSYPNKAQRTECYNSRDQLWNCLDKNNDKIEKCEDIRKLFKSKCPEQWVTHFDRKREYLKFKDKIEKNGYEPIDGTNNK